MKKRYVLVFKNDYILGGIYYSFDRIADAVEAVINQGVRGIHASVVDSHTRKIVAKVSIYGDSSERKS